MWQSDATKLCVMTKFELGSAQFAAITRADIVFAVKDWLQRT